MKRDQVDLENKIVWIPDSKTPNGVAEVPLTDLAVEALRDQMQLGGGQPVPFTQRECRRASDDVQDGLAAPAATSEGAVLPDLRPPLDVRVAPERRWRGGRVGDPAAPAGGREGVQEVLANEAADEARGAGQAEPNGKRITR